MHMKNVLLLLLTALACASTVGCATRDRRDAPWDPPRGRQLMEQIPQWDHPTSRCCGRDVTKCQPHQTPRC